MSNRLWDALILTDPRFIGGTLSAVATDIRAFQAMGLRVGVHLVEAQGFFEPEDMPHPAFEDLLALEGVELVNPSVTAHAKLAFFHHPAVFFNRVGAPLQVAADKAVIVTHQPLFFGNGALIVDPFTVQRNIRSQFGPRPEWAPISGLCRRQYLSMAPFLKLTQTDWLNTFAVEDWTPHRAKLTGPDLVVGRHSRPDPEKWPDRGTDLAASLPAGPQTKIRVMGAGQEFYQSYNVDASNWDVLEFNQEPAAAFLDRLDVYSYFHSANWTEAFGRNVAEAMLMGARCILDPALEPTFGRHAIYCAPSEVGSVLTHIRNNLDQHRAATKAAQAHCIETYSTQTIAARYHQMLNDKGTVSRRDGTSTPPWTVARKFIGFHRRNKTRQEQAAS